LLDIDSQMIKLIVSPGDDELRVEEDAQNIKEAI
jgi:hypothetical protein